MNIRPLSPGETESVLGAGLGLSRMPRDDGSFYLVAWEDDEPVGHAHLALDDPPELQDVEVLPSHRRRGVASALTRAAEDEIRARGGALLTLTVSADNAAAQSVYRTLGYRDSGAPPRRVQGTVQIRSGTIEVDDTLLSWQKELKPRALFLHGGPGLPDYLDPLADELAPVFEIERYQQQPHADVPSFVDEAVEHLPGPRWLVGHSWGGYLALQTAARAPELVLGMVLLDSLGGVGDGGWAASRPRLRARLSENELAQLEKTAPGEGLRILWPAYFADRTLAPPYPAWTGDAETLAAIWAWVQEHRSAELAPLARFERPVLLLHGAEDFIPLEAAEETALLLPDAELRVLDGIGHFAWLEAPGSVREAIIDWGRVPAVDFGAARSS